MRFNEIKARFLLYADDRFQTKMVEPIPSEYINSAYETLLNDEETAARRTSRIKSTDIAVTATAAGVDFESTLPSDFRQVSRVEKIEASGPKKMELADFDKKNEVGDWSFLAYMFEDHSTSIAYVTNTVIGVVNPTSGFTMRLHYHYQPAKLEDAGDIPEIPTAYHDLIARLAANEAREDLSMKVAPSAIARAQSKRRDFKRHVSRRYAIAGD